MMGYPWRGLLIDVARSYFPPLVLRRLIDDIAALGLNVLHLHLTDDQGWRLEIPGRPELARRSGGTAIAGAEAGYLTVADWADLNAYADARGVTLVPEIDVPGHVHAALHAVDALNPTGIAPAAYDGTAVGFSRLTADLPATELFLRDVLGAVAVMTPGPWIHIGGDECLGLPDDEYVRLVRLAASIVEEYGKTPVAWQEAALAGLGERLVLQFWMSSAGEEAYAGVADAAARGDAQSGPSAVPPEVVAAIRSRAGLLREAGRGAKVILSPAQYTYFDLKYTPTSTLGQDWAGTITVDKAGGWDPRTVLPGLNPAAILGVEAAMWTETVHTEADLTMMLGPRLEAFARVTRS